MSVLVWPWYLGSSGHDFMVCSQGLEFLALKTHFPHDWYLMIIPFFILHCIRTCYSPFWDIFPPSVTGEVLFMFQGGIQSSSLRNLPQPTQTSLIIPSFISSPYTWVHASISALIMPYSHYLLTFCLYWTLSSL